MSESCDLEIKDLPPEEALTSEEKELLAGAGRLKAFANGMFTSLEDRMKLMELGWDQQASAISVWQTYEKAEPYLHAYAEKIRAACGEAFLLIKGPMKSFKRAYRKLDPKTPFEKMKDIIRVTIIAPNAESLRIVAAKLDDWGNRHPWTAPKNLQVHAVNNDFAYSGLNYVLQTSELPGVGKLGFPVNLEIQGNVPWMIYGKEIDEDFIAMLGGGEFAHQEFKKIQSWTHIVSGLGHALYEIWEKVGARDKREAEQLSRDYYTYLRRRVPNGPNDPGFSELCTRLEAFFKRFSGIPKHPVPEQVSVTPRGPVAPPGPGLKRASAPMLNDMPVYSPLVSPPARGPGGLRFPGIR